MKNLLLICLLALLSLAASSQQGVVQLPATGQTTSYYPGDDGDLQMGVAIPVNRFTDHGNGSATDQLSGLMWAIDGNLIASRDPDFDQDRTAGDGDINWDTALDYIQKLNDESYLGHSDWRMPNFLELLSLVNLGNDSITLPDGHPFINLQRGYWSSTTNVRLCPTALMVCLTDYVVHSGITYPAGHWESLSKDLGESNAYFNAFLFPVRDGDISALVDLAKTGQSINYYNGDDGDLWKGAMWPSPRLVDNNNGTVTDNLSGLMWTKDYDLMFTRDIEFDTSGAANGWVPWITAIGYINKLNNEAFLGYNDWRLPNRNELASLIDYSRRDYSCLPKNHPFTNSYGVAYTVGFGYWSSSTLADDPEKAWSFNFGLYNLYSFSKTDECTAWPVRSVNTPASTGSIQGHIIGDDMPLDRVEISLSGPIDARTETNSEGYFEFQFLPDGMYTVTPYFEYFNITPESKTVNVSGSSVNCDFNAVYHRAYGWVDISNKLYYLNGYYCPNFHDVYFLDENEGWITSLQGIYHTTDGGQTFEEQILPLEGDYANAIFMLNEDLGYIGSGGGWIYKTLNGGDEWTIHGSTGSYIFDMDFPPNSDIGYSTGENGSFWQINPDGVFQIETGLNGGLPGVSSLSNNSTYFAGDVNRLFHFDGNEITPCCMPNGAVASIYFHNDTMGWAAMEASHIGGLHGLGIYNCGEVRGIDENQTTLEDIHSPNGKDLWLVGQPGAIIYSPNANDFTYMWPDQYNNTVWSRQAIGLSWERLNSVHFTTTTSGYTAGNNGTLLKYTQLPGAPLGADILGVRFPGQYGKEVINTTDRKVEVEVADSIDITNLVPEIYVSAEAIIDPPSGTAKDFSNPVTYTVTSPDNITKTWTISVTKVFGIDDYNKQSNEVFFTIHPNPCRDKIQISNLKLQTNSKLKTQNSKLEIIDLHGRVVYSKEIGDVETSMDVNLLPSGLYLVKLQTEDGVGVRKLIKK